VWPLVSRLSLRSAGTRGQCEWWPLCPIGAPRRALGRDTSALLLTRWCFRHLTDASHRVVSYSQCQTALVSSFPVHSCLRVLFLPFHLRRCRPPSEGDWRSAERRPALYVSRSNARRHACEAWALPRNREARLTALRRGVVGPGPASVPVAGSGAKAPRHQPYDWLRCRAFRIRGYQPRSTPHPAPPSGSSPDDAPHERDVRYVVRPHAVVKK
jgi:hypothetical protein